MLEQVQSKSLFTSFPNADEEGSGPSKRALAKMAKAQAAKDKKAQKAAGGDQAPEESKGGKQKQ